MQEKPVSLLTVVTSVLCAVAWDIVLLVHFFYHGIDGTPFFLRFVCAIVWTVSATAWVKRYVRWRREQARRREWEWE